MKEHFNGREEDRGKPNVVTAEEQVSRANEYHNWLDEGNKEGGAGDPSKVHGVKRRSILHNLPYWKVMMELQPLKFVIHALIVAVVHVQAMGRQKGNKPRHPYF